jgi:hypothetical protein
MSVVGFDVGNDASCVALARKRGIDVLMNKESKRETPSCISFGEKMRFLGTDGAAKISMNPKNTVNQLKRLIGKKFKDPQVQTDISKLPFSVTEGPDGGLLVNVMYCNERHSFTPEQLMAMVLVDLKKIAEAEGGIPVVDCCISVPAFYTEAERYAMLAAASTAGLNTLRLINETTATAIAYGIYKTDLPETDPVNVAFVDIGHAATQVRTPVECPIQPCNGASYAPAIHARIPRAAMAIALSSYWLTCRHRPALTCSSMATRVWRTIARHAHCTWLNIPMVPPRRGRGQSIAATNAAIHGPAQQGLPMQLLP